LKPGFLSCSLLDLLSRFAQRRRKQPGWDRHRAKAKHEYEKREDSPADGDWVDVAVANGCQGDNGPPQAVKDGGKLVGLRSVLEALDEPLRQ